MKREELKPKEYGGKKYTKYEALQKQRRMETTMRAQRQKIKLLEEGGADEDDIINARCRYRGTSAEYARFSKAMDLPQQRERAYIEGLEKLEGKVSLKEWIDQPVRIKSFASTSVFRDTAYSSEVEMTILVPKNKTGSGYVNEISHHHLTSGYKDEYEVVLQNDSEYAIIEAQYYKDKLFLIVEWLGG